MAMDLERLHQDGDDDYVGCTKKVCFANGLIEVDGARW